MPSACNGAEWWAPSWGEEPKTETPPQLPQTRQPPSGKPLTPEDHRVAVETAVSALKARKRRSKYAVKPSIW